MKSDTGISNPVPDKGTWKPSRAQKWHFALKFLGHWFGARFQWKMMENVQGHLHPVFCRKLSPTSRLQETMARHGVQARWRSLLPGMVIIFGEQGPWEADDGLQHWAWLANGEDAIAVVFNVLKSKGFKGLRKNEKDAISIAVIAEKCLTTLKNSHPPQQSYRVSPSWQRLGALTSKQYMGIPRYIMI